MKRCKRVMAVILTGMMLSEGVLAQNCGAQVVESEVCQSMATPQEPVPSEMVEPTKAPDITLGENISAPTVSLEKSQEEKSCSNIRVAVLDSGYTGVRNKRIVDSGANFSDSGREGDIADDNGHGSAMADIILEHSRQNVQVIPIKVLNQQGQGTVASVAMGIERALQLSADIINLSVESVQILGSERIQELFQRAKEQQVLIFVAGGNQSASVEEAAGNKADNVLLISAIDGSMEKAVYSNYGMGIDFSALGQIPVENYFGRKTYTGTSVATSLCAAVATKYEATLSCEEKIQRLRQEARDLGEPGYDSWYGYGCLYFEPIEGEKDREEKEEIEEENKRVSVVSKEEPDAPKLGKFSEWRELSDEALNELIQESTEKEVADFVKALTKGEQEEIFRRDTDLNKTVQEVDFDENGYFVRERTYVFMEYLLTEPVRAQSLTVFGNTTGYFYAKYSQDGVVKGNRTKITITVNNVTPWTALTEKPRYTLKSSDSSIFKISQNQTETYADANGDYYCIRTTLVRTNVPAHYYPVSWETDYLQSDGSDRINLEKVTSGHSSSDYDCEFVLRANTNGCGLTWWGPEQANGIDYAKRYTSTALHNEVTINFSRYSEKLYIDPNGGSYKYTVDGEEVTKKNKFLLSTKKCEQSISIKTPTRSGCRFHGWKTIRENGGSGTYDSSEKKYYFCGRKSNSATILEAQWLTNTPTPKIKATNTPKPQGTNTPKPQGTGTPKPGVTGTPKPGGTSTPKPEVTGTPKPQVTGMPKPGGTSTPKPEVTGMPKPEGISTPKPEGTSIPIPQITSIPLPEETSTPTPTATSTPTPTATNTPTPTPFYTIRYKKNNQGCSTKDQITWVSREERDFSYNGGVALEGQVSMPGYEFTGWNTRADGSGVSFAGGAYLIGKDILSKVGISPQNSYSVIVLYAMWKPRTYTLTFCSNEPTRGNNTHEASHKAEVERTKLSFAWDERIVNGKIGGVAIPDAALTGWHQRFSDGLWYTGPHFQNPQKVLKDGTVLGLDTFGSVGNQTVYAQWEANTYVVSYCGNGEKDNNRGVVSGQMEEQILTYDKKELLYANVYTKQDEKFSHHDEEHLSKNTYGLKYNDTASTDFQYAYLGWSRQQYKEGVDFVRKDDFISKGMAKTERAWNFTREDKGRVKLYACWNGIPNITLARKENHFVRYEDAKISMEDLKALVKAYDLEEGDISSSLTVDMIRYYYEGQEISAVEMETKPTANRELLDTSLKGEGKKSGGYRKYEIVFGVRDGYQMFPYCEEAPSKEVNFTGKILYNEIPEIFGYKGEENFKERYLYLEGIQKETKEWLEENLLLQIVTKDVEDETYSLSPDDLEYQGRKNNQPIVKVVDLEHLYTQIKDESTWKQEELEKGRRLSYEIRYEDIFGKEIKKEGTLYVISARKDTALDGNRRQRYVRFISKEYLDTLDESSGWRGGEKEEILKKSLEEGNPNSTATYQVP